MPVTLSNALLLREVTPSGVKETSPTGFPTYLRSDVTTGIVHFGVGGFHRAHQAMVIDTLMREGKALDWGICGVGVLPVDAKMRDVMREQDSLYTLVYKHADGSRDARVIGSIVEYLFAPDDPEAVIEKMADTSTRIVSLTVTEGGYNFDQKTGEFDSSTPAIQADLVPGAMPATVFGLVVEALARRRERGIPPFTIMSCDNIQGNGHMARRTFSAFASLRDPELGGWVLENVAFPNSMVDRITPVTTDDDRAEVLDRFGIFDAWPVVCEPFFQWVLEDTFPLGRPPFEDAGVQVVGDVEPYELMKLRLLNVSHQAMCYFGFLSGYRYAHEATADPVFAKFLRDYMDREATPTLKPVPGVDLDDYKLTLIERFANSEIRDTLARLCAESSDRIPKWLLPVIRAQLESDGEIFRSAGIVASWARYAEATDEQGAPIVVIDRLVDELVPLAQSQKANPVAFISNEQLFGDLAESPRFVEAYVAALNSLWAHGAHATVKDLAR